MLREKINNKLINEEKDSKLKIYCINYVKLIYRKIA